MFSTEFWRVWSAYEWDKSNHNTVKKGYFISRQKLVLEVY